jgi:hypothetical protein
MRATLMLMIGAAAVVSACRRDEIYSPRPEALPASAPMPASGPPAFVGRWAASPADCARRAWVLTAAALDAPDRTHCAFAKLSPGSAGYGVDVDCRGPGPEQIGRLTLTLSGEGAERGLTVAGGPFALPVALTRCPG